ncbi:hypothetical protein M5K25_015812 [Dendrobium thyrsiflorum]|uniref:Uncharacterized protein n=1 Tax=Dendrobium thyrsiflorum TaxID=117978 RepID=A0ABD0US25_DENTH
MRLFFPLFHLHLQYNDNECIASMVDSYRHKRHIKLANFMLELKINEAEEVDEDPLPVETCRDLYFSNEYESEHDISSQMGHVRLEGDFGPKNESPEATITDFEENTSLNASEPNEYDILERMEYKGHLANSVFYLCSVIAFSTGLKAASFNNLRRERYFRKSCSRQEARDWRPVEI